MRHAYQAKHIHSLATIIKLLYITYVADCWTSSLISNAT